MIAFLIAWLLVVCTLGLLLAAEGYERRARERDRAFWREYRLLQFDHAVEMAEAENRRGLAAA